MLRPHNILIEPAVEAGTGWRGSVRFRRHVGALMEYEVKLGDGVSLRVVALRDETVARIDVGDRVALRLRDPAACIAFPRA